MRLSSLPAIGLLSAFIVLPLPLLASPIDVSYVVQEIGP
jgi:hypothetical protein